MVHVLPCGVDCERLSKLQSRPRRSDVGDARMLGNRRRGNAAAKWSSGHFRSFFMRRETPQSATPAASPSSSRPFRFLFTGGALPRKGIDILLAAWQEAFCSSISGPKVELILHTNYGLGFSKRELHFMEQRAKTHCSNVRWQKGWLSRTSHLDLLRSADAYVAPARAEGFGIPVVEAMVLGKPVITTVSAESGRPGALLAAADDFFSDEIGWPVHANRSACTRYPCDHRNALLCVFGTCVDDGWGWTCGCRQLVNPPEWLEPSVRALSAQLRRIVDDGAFARGDKAAKAQERATSRYCWPAVQTLYAERIAALAASRATRTANPEIDLSSNVPHRTEWTNALVDPCKRVDIDRNDASYCNPYERLPLIIPNCTRRSTIVPRIYHAISGGKAPPHIVMMNAAANPSYRLNYLDDRAAVDYIHSKCGQTVGRAYACINAPAYRADLFRYCALYAEGGVYMDTDIVALHPLPELYSPCSEATVGHDMPAPSAPGLQMKLLAGAPMSALFRCMVDAIVHNVRTRFIPTEEEGSLSVSGPSLLYKCYRKLQLLNLSHRIAINHIDTRGAAWPYTGLRTNKDILAYERPNTRRHIHAAPGDDKNDYGTLHRAGAIYTANCDILFHNSSR